MDNIYRDLDNGSLSGVFFLDLRKAFDTVSHKIPFRKLESIDMSPYTLSWFTSYHNGHSQVTRVGANVLKIEH